jgi:hypothetical protein
MKKSALQTFFIMSSQRSALSYIVHSRCKINPTTRMQQKHSASSTQAQNPEEQGVCSEEDASTKPGRT